MDILNGKVKRKCIVVYIMNMMIGQEDFVKALPYDSVLFSSFIHIFKETFSLYFCF